MAYKRYQRVRNHRCGFCGGVGHNRATCKLFKETLTKMLEEDPDNVAANTLLDYEKAKKARRSKPRQCSFCGVEGHNRATCPELKKEVSRMADANIAYRKKILEILTRLEITEYCIVGFNSRHTRLILEKIVWDNFNFWNRKLTYPGESDGVFQCIPLTPGVDRRHFYSTFADPEMLNLRFSQERTGARYEADQLSFPVLKSSTGKDIAPPDNWLDRDHVEKEIKDYLKLKGFKYNQGWFQSDSITVMTKLQEEITGFTDPGSSRLTRLEFQEKTFS